MCHGHPHTHPCSHTSVAWDYCPAAHLDLDTGYESPCADISFSPARPTAEGCPLQHCQFKDMGGSWQCCACGRGPNTRGWCTMPTARLRRDPETFEVEAVEATCDHGCCNNCTYFGTFPFSDTSAVLRRASGGVDLGTLTGITGTSRSPTPDHPFADLRRSPRRYTHHRPSRYSGDEAQASSSSASSSLSSSASSSPGYKIDLDYSSVAKKKGSGTAKKARKGKNH